MKPSEFSITTIPQATLEAMEAMATARKNRLESDPSGKNPNEAGAKLDEDGKILKPETYTPPNLLPFAEVVNELHLA